jgi:hypothetical protein
MKGKGLKRVDVDDYSSCKLFLLDYVSIKGSFILDKFFFIQFIFKQTEGRSMGKKKQSTVNN